VHRLLPSALLVLAACDGLTTGVKAPQGLTCVRIKAAAPDKLTEALAAAGDGDCVIAPEGTWVGSFTVPSNVSLAASEGERVVLRGDGSDNPVLRVMGGERTSVRNVVIDTSGGGGIAIDPGPAALIGVSISGTSKNALTATCTREDCPGESSLEGSELTAAAAGVKVSKVALRIENSRIANIQGTALGDGNGVVAFDGAKLTMKSVQVENNGAIGVLVDGYTTSAALTDCTVAGNGSRGVWIQRATQGSVSITGGEVTNNALVGIGARDSANLSIVGTQIRSTRSVRVQVDLSTREDVGDGIGLFSGVHDAVIENVLSRDNARAQLLADGIGAKVSVRTPDVSGGLYRVVSQRSIFTLEAPPAVVDNPGKDLYVEASAQVP
jgi:hypothetical protein